MARNALTLGYGVLALVALYAVAAATDDEGLPVAGAVAFWAALVASVAMGAAGRALAAVLTAAAAALLVVLGGAIADVTSWGELWFANAMLTAAIFAALAGLGALGAWVLRRAKRT